MSFAALHMKCSSASRGRVEVRGDLLPSDEHAEGLVGMNGEERARRRPPDVRRARPKHQSS